MLDIRTALPQLLPQAVQWVQDLAHTVLADGLPLDELGLQLARKVGVSNPERIRVLEVEHLPLPADPQLCQAALSLGMLGPRMVGLTVGYGILICRGYLDARLLSHESRHVYQYEQAGSIEAFLPEYLSQVIEFGYQDAPLERDARAHELHAPH